MFPLTWCTFLILNWETRQNNTKKLYSNCNKQMHFKNVTFVWMEVWESFGDALLCCCWAAPAIEATKCHIRCGNVKGPLEVSLLCSRPVNVPTGGSSLHGGRVKFNDPRGVKAAYEAWFRKSQNQLYFIFWLFGRQNDWTCSHLFNN